MNLVTERNQPKMGNILIVDDDYVSTLISETLLKKHFNLTSVTNGYEALKAVSTNHFDIILMDINLGDDSMDGIQTMKLLKQNPDCNDTKIFAVTAYYENRDFFINKGFDELYTKPIIKEEMIEAINKILLKNAC